MYCTILYMGDFLTWDIYYFIKKKFFFQNFLFSGGPIQVRLGYIHIKKFIYIYIYTKLEDRQPN